MSHNEEQNLLQANAVGLRFATIFRSGEHKFFMAILCQVISNYTMMPDSLEFSVFSVRPLRPSLLCPEIQAAEEYAGGILE